MSASNTSFFRGIALALQAMWKTCTNLSKKVDKIEKQQTNQDEQVKDLEIKMTEIVKQHLEIIKQLKHISILQKDIAQQVVTQHQETQALMKGLGLKKDISYYSFNLHNGPEH